MGMVGGELGKVESWILVVDFEGMDRDGKTWSQTHEYQFRGDQVEYFCRMVSATSDPVTIRCSAEKSWFMYIPSKMDFSDLTDILALWDRIRLGWIQFQRYAATSKFSIWRNGKGIGDEWGLLPLYPPDRRNALLKRCFAAKTYKHTCFVCSWSTQ